MALLASPLEAVLGGVVDLTFGWFVHPAADLSVQMVRSKAPVADLTRQKAGVNGTAWLEDSRTDLYCWHQTSVLESSDSYKIPHPPPCYGSSVPFLQTTSVMRPMSPLG